jgi:putative ABC transport system permease protein
MNAAQVFYEALRSLNANRLRSGLTMLGVIIGIASVLLMLSVGDGVRAFIDKELAVLGRNQILISPVVGNDGAVGGNQQRDSLTVADAHALAELPHVLRAGAAVMSRVQAAFPNANENLQVQAVTPEMFAISNWKLAHGLAVDATDVQRALRVVVIGETLAKQHFADADPLGQSVRLGGVPYVVIGVLSGTGRNINGEEQGKMLVVPISAPPVRWVARSGAVQQVNVQAHDAASVAEASYEVRELLRDRHHITGDKKDDFDIADLAGLAKTGAAIGAGLSVGLGVIGGISLLVGGIGIMNIMLVSVSERVREIGLRMAIGAKPRDVLWQFLGEAVVLCLLGGAVALGLAALGVMGVNATGKFTMALSAQHILIAIGFASGVGLFFGYYPARRASRLLPIECLRAD